MHSTNLFAIVTAKTTLKITFYWQPKQTQLVFQVILNICFCFLSVVGHCSFYLSSCARATLLTCTVLSATTSWGRTIADKGASWMSKPTSATLVLFQIFHLFHSYFFLHYLELFIIVKICISLLI